jgi:hypothetical protein
VQTLQKAGSVNRRLVNPTTPLRAATFRYRRICGIIKDWSAVIQNGQAVELGRGDFALIDLSPP